MMHIKTKILFENTIQDYYIMSLQVIKYLHITNEKEYNEQVKNDKILSSESLKYISQTRNFKKIVKIAKETV